MKHYKSLLLFSATALLLVGGAVSADEVSQSSTQEQPAAVVSQADSQANQPAEASQQVTQTETTQANQTQTTSEDNSQAQESTVQQGEASAPNGQETSSQSPEEATNQNQKSTETQADTNAVTESDSQEGQDNPDISTEEYEANVAELKQVTMADVYHMFDDQDGNYTLYLGRPTCIYCRKFSSVIKDFNTLSGGQVYYYNTDSSDFTPVAKEFLRTKIGAFGTPTVLHLEKGQIVSGQLGSGGTAQELYDKVFKPENTKTNASEETTTGQETQTAGENPTEPAGNTNDSKPSADIKGTTDQSQTKAEATPQTEKLDTNTLTKIINKLASLINALLAKLGI
ncbi:thioredoxin family protein [Streptococcus sobrinus]|uniref:thioredoxin family protein n=2 Tax=Streptococcus sobrinus TaxID=1310 RepID=UPI0002F899E2|nr:thioredoxin family protein [Streptococcus sobrinus]OZV23714.1 thiol reductase thioredoxin [Streptococcus sobrinus]